MIWILLTIFGALLLSPLAIISAGYCIRKALTWLAALKKDPLGTILHAAAIIVIIWAVVATLLPQRRIIMECCVCGSADDFEEDE